MKQVDVFLSYLKYQIEGRPDLGQMVKVRADEIGY